MFRTRSDPNTGVHGNRQRLFSGHRENVVPSIAFIFDVIFFIPAGNEEGIYITPDEFDFEQDHTIYFGVTCF